MDYDNEKINFLAENLSTKRYRNGFEKAIVNELKRFKLFFGKAALLRILFCLLVLFLILFRGHVMCLIGFLTCYVTWPFSSPTHVNVNLLNLSNEPKGHEYIPRRMHHILLGPLSSNPPES